MDPVEAFEEHRATLRSVAYRLLGSVADAEDAVQDAWPRWQKAAGETTVDEPRAYLITIVTRLCLDRLRSATARRETYVGSWLPEPSTTEPAADPADQVSLRDSVSLGMLVLLESLSPLERAAFVLHEAFGFTHAEAGRALDRGEATVRQLVRRARAHLAEGRGRFDADREVRREVTEKFMRAAVTGDLAALLEVLSPDVTLVTDTNGKVKGNLRVIATARKVARAFAGTVDQIPPGTRIVHTDVNGLPGAVAVVDGVPYAVFSCDASPDGHVTRILLQANPDKLAGIRLPATP